MPPPHLSFSSHFFSTSCSAASSAPSATKAAETTMRRFWKRVSLDVARHDGEHGDGVRRGDFVVRLDGRRPLRTPGGKVLAVPSRKPLLAALLAREWSEQKVVLKPHALPFTSLASRAIDGMSDSSSRSNICQELARYLDTDTVCFHEDHPPILVRLQGQHWEPLLSWVRGRFQVSLRTFEGVVGAHQDEAAVESLRRHVEGYDAWTLAAFERAVLSTKSFLIALRIVESASDVARDATSGADQVVAQLFGAEEAAQAAEVEVRSQVERWGEVDDTHDVDHAELRARLGSVVLSLRDDAALPVDMTRAEATATA